MTRNMLLVVLVGVVAACATQSELNASSPPVVHKLTPTELAAMAGSNEIEINVAGVKARWQVSDLCSVARHEPGSEALYDPVTDRVLVVPPEHSTIAMQAVTCTCVGTDTGGCSPFEGTVDGVPISGCTKGCTRCDGTRTTP